MNEQEKKADEKSLRSSSISTFLVALLTFFSRILGFIRIGIISAIFGSSEVANVFNAVFVIPNSLRKLLAEGALSTAFIPVFSHTLVQDETQNRGRNLSRAVLTVQLLILIPLSGFAVIFAGPLMGVLTEFKDPELLQLSANLFRWFINYLIFISVAALLMGILNSHSQFLIPAVMPLLFSVAMISSVLLFHQKLGIYATILGVLGGGVLQLLFIMPSYLSLGYSFKPSIQFRNADFKKVMGQWLPILATSSVFTLNTIIANRFATAPAMEFGSPTFLQNAIVFWQLPFGIFSASITTVFYPKMSRQVSRKDLSGVKESLEYGLQALFSLLVPSSLFLSLLGREIIAVGIQRGAWHSAATLATGEILFYYSLGLFMVGAFSFIQRTFFSLGKHKTPFYIASITVVMDVLLSLWLKETALNVRGLALANSLAFSLGLVLMIIFVRKELGRLNFKKLGLGALKVLVSLIPVYLFIRFYLIKTGDWWLNGSTMKNFGHLTLVGTLSVFILLIMFYLTRVDIIRILIKKSNRQ